MHEGDRVKFIFPSQSAYGYHGDDKKIGTNQPIICIVTLNKIKSVTPE
jgi:FKBP-type peptidyl-prolyl cis-trans isomerase